MISYLGTIVTLYTLLFCWGSTEGLKWAYSVQKASSKIADPTFHGTTFSRFFRVIGISRCYPLWLYTGSKFKQWVGSSVLALSLSSPILVWAQPPVLTNNAYSSDMVSVVESAVPMDSKIITLPDGVQYYDVKEGEILL